MRVLRYGASLFLLFFSWLTFQASPFFPLGFLALYVLTTSFTAWRQQRNNYLIFMTLTVFTMSAYVAAYKYVLDHVPVENLYVLSEQSFHLLSKGTFSQYVSLLDPARYGAIFEWWNYIFPIKRLPSALYLQITVMNLYAWVGLIMASFLIECKQNSRLFVLQKYSLALSAFGLTLLPIIADGFTQRQHVYIAAVPAAFLIGAHCVRVIFDYMQSRVYLYMAIAVLLFSYVGAHAVFYRSIIFPSSRFYVFVTGEIARQYHERIEKVIVINTPQVCNNEPCRGFMDRQMGIADRRRSYFYTTLLEQISGKDNEIPIEFSQGDVPYQDTTMVIDYRLLYAQVNQ